MKIIKTLSLLMILAGIGLAVFGYWGLFTKAGNRVYDEMDGMIPYFSLIASTFCFITGLTGIFVSHKISKKI